MQKRIKPKEWSMTEIRGAGGDITPEFIAAVKAKGRINVKVDDEVSFAYSYNQAQNDRILETRIAGGVDQTPVAYGLDGKPIKSGFPPIQELDD
jgi:hypothetical protein